MFQEFDVESNDYLLVDVFLYSHHLSALYCMDIVRRNYVLVTRGSGRVNGCLDNFFFPLIKLFLTELVDMILAGTPRKRRRAVSEEDAKIPLAKG